MKTKNVIVSVLVIISSILGVSAVYSAEPIKAEVTLNIKLNPIQTITVKHTSVNIEYGTSDKYLNVYDIKNTDNKFTTNLLTQ